MIYIGIDCGKRTGFAVWDSDAKHFIEIKTYKLHKALEMARYYMTEHYKNTIFVFEDARQRKYLARERSVSEYRGKLMGAGSVKRDAVIWEEFCKDHKLVYQAVPPRKGMTKWQPWYFAKVTGWTARTSEHARDAAMLVFNK